MELLFFNKKYIFVYPKDKHVTMFQPLLRSLCKLPMSSTDCQALCQALGVQEVPSALTNVPGIYPLSDAFLGSDLGSLQATEQKVPACEALSGHGAAFHSTLCDPLAHLSLLLDCDLLQKREISVVQGKSQSWARDTTISKKGHLCWQPFLGPSPARVPAVLPLRVQVFQPGCLAAAPVHLCIALS